LEVALALLATTGLAGGCAAVGADATAAATVRESGGGPRPDVWVTFDPSGGGGSTVAQKDGNFIVTAGHMRPPIFSLRIPAYQTADLSEAELLTPLGFHDRHIRAGDVSEEAPSTDPYSNAAQEKWTLERALSHHRPAVRFSVDDQGKLRTQKGPEAVRHDRCALRLLRRSAERLLATAENDVQRSSERESLESGDFAGGVSPPVEPASILLRLAKLSLPNADEHASPARGAEPLEALPAQDAWRAQQIRVHGRPVRLDIDLLSDGASAGAKVCRSLAYEERLKLRTDVCTIKGVIDRRDGWPITITLSRSSEATDGSKENQFRSFRRLTPLEGFVPPANPCPVKG
jgi:hypothetical protein